MLPPGDPSAANRIQPARLAQGPRDVTLSPSLREHLTQANYPPVVCRGITDVTHGEIERAAGVAAEELASVYTSRDEAAADFLAYRARDWTIGMIEAGARVRAILAHSYEGLDHLGQRGRCPRGQALPEHGSRVDSRAQWHRLCRARTHFRRVVGTL